MLQFLLMVFNGIWNLFQLFITHFFSDPMVAQHVFFFSPALYEFLSLLWLLWGCNVLSWFISSLLFMYQFGREITVRAQLCGQATVRGCGRTLHLLRFFSGLFPPACLCSVIHLSQLQDLKPTIHLADFRNFMVPQLDWCMIPCSSLDELCSMCCVEGVRSSTWNIFGRFSVLESVPVSVLDGEQHW